MFGAYPEDISSDEERAYNGVTCLRENPFNQDLSYWDVNNVTECQEFSDGASNWVLAQPNFTNCNPN